MKRKESFWTSYNGNLESFRSPDPYLVYSNKKKMIYIF